MKQVLDDLDVMAMNSPERVHVKIARSADYRDTDLFMKEALFLSRVNHPHIVKYIAGGLSADGRAFIKMPKLNNHPQVPLSVQRDHTFQADLLASVLSVLDFLRLLNLCHGDLKPQHILFDDNGKPVVIDFAQIFFLSRSTLIGTGEYLAPELFWRYGYSMQSDLFSLGVSLCQMFFPDEVVDRLLAAYRQCLRPWDENDLKVLQGHLRSQPHPLGKVVSRMVSFSPFDRPANGLEIVEFLSAEGLTTWTKDGFLSVVGTAIPSYLYNVHWITADHAILRRRQNECIEVRHCHEGCHAAFAKNLRILIAFRERTECQPPAIRSARNGSSICKLRYVQGVVPRVLPKAQSVPHWVDIGQYLSPSHRFRKLRWDYSLPIAFVSSAKTVDASNGSDESSAADILSIQKLILERKLSQAEKAATAALSTCDTEDETRVVLTSYLAFCTSHIAGPNKAVDVLDSVSQATLNDSSPAARGEFYSTLGWCQYLLGKHDAAIHAFAKSLVACSRIRESHPLLLAVVYNRLASVKWQSDSTAKALYFNGRALRFAARSHYPELTANILLNRCVYLGDMGNYNQEQAIQKRLRRLFREIHAAQLVVNYLLNLGIFYIRTGRPERALAVLERSYALAVTEGKIPEIAHILLSLGNAYLSIGDMQRAVTCWKASAEQFSRTGNKYGAAKVYQNLAEVFFLTGNDAVGQESADRARALYSEINHTAGLIDLKLMELLHSDGTQFDPTRIQSLISECVKFSYYWGEYHAAFHGAALYLARRDWTSFEQACGQLQGVTSRYNMDTGARELVFLRALYRLAKVAPTVSGIDGEQSRFLDMVRQIDSASCSKRRNELCRLSLDVLNKLDENGSFKPIIRELKIEGRIMSHADDDRDNSHQSKGAHAAYVDKLDALRQVTEIMNESEGVEEYAHKALELTVRVLRASRGAIFLVSKFSEELELLCDSGVTDGDVHQIRDISRSLLRKSVAGESVFVRDASSETKYEQVESLLAKGIKSAICIPLKRSDEVFGVVYIDSVHYATHFEDIDRTFLNTFGAIISEGIRTSHRLHRLNEDHRYTVSGRQDIGLKMCEGLLLPSPPMQEIYRTIFKIAKTNFSVLLLGQSGAGKDVLARLIHENSSVSTGPMVAINCSAIPTANLESELFGVSHSSFTGVSEHPGRIELADGGSLFLDEVGDIPPHLQSKLLRVIETKVVERLGGYESKKVDFRLMSASNQDLREMVAKGQFREDLYHRINDFVIDVPSLAKRPEDIRVLIDHFYRYYQSELNVTCIPLNTVVVEALLKYHWPGGIRELSKTVRRLIVLSEDGRPNLEALPDAVRGSLPLGMYKTQHHLKKQPVMTRDELLTALRRNRFNIRRTAKEMTIPESTLRYRMRRHRITPTPSRLRG